MSEAPITPDPEQQRADNEASRRQSGLDPSPPEQDAEAADRKASDRGSEGEDHDGEARDRSESGPGGAER